MHTFPLHAIETARGKMIHSVRCMRFGDIWNGGIWCSPTQDLSSCKKMECHSYSDTSTIWWKRGSRKLVSIRTIIRRIVSDRVEQRILAELVSSLVISKSGVAGSPIAGNATIWNSTSVTSRWQRDCHSRTSNWQTPIHIPYATNTATKSKTHAPDSTAYHAMKSANWWWTFWKMPTSNKHRNKMETQQLQPHGRNQCPQSNRCYQHLRQHHQNVRHRHRIYRFFHRYMKRPTMPWNWNELRYIEESRPQSNMTISD